MQKKQYITIGNPIISKDIFRNILRPLDNFSFKPTGGLWASEFISNFNKISPWYDYLKEAKSITTYMLRYKDLKLASIFTLKENANILIIDSVNQILELSKKYPSYHHILTNNNNIIFDFEEISRKYDGIYLNYNNLLYQTTINTFDSWNVNTLLIFNLDCIKEYQTVKINIDFEDYDPLPYIDDKDISMPKEIQAESNTYRKLSNNIKAIYNELEPLYINNKIKNYNEYLESLVLCANKVLEISTITKEKEIHIIKETLKEQGINIDTKIIIRNIVLNYLSNYLNKEKNNIINLQKSQTKERKRYLI